VHQRCQLVNETSEVKVKELIECYQEGIQLMKKGARYKFFIPWELAWGKNGTGSKIPPYSMLVFDVRLIDFW
ncbi:MAG: peptidylprolyl isomerase, partial [Bacteroidetes bacterium]